MDIETFLPLPEVEVGVEDLKLGLAFFRDIAQVTFPMMNRRRIIVGAVFVLAGFFIALLWKNAPVADDSTYEARGATPSEQSDARPHHRSGERLSSSVQQEQSEAQEDFLSVLGLPPALQGAQVLDVSVSDASTGESLVRRRLVEFERYPFPIVIEEAAEPSPSNAPGATDPTYRFLTAYAAHQVLAYFGSDPIEELKRSGLDDHWHVARTLSGGRVSVLETDQPTLDAVTQAIDALYEMSSIEFAEPDAMYFASETRPNDPSFQDGSQWGLDDPEHPEFDINAPEAWSQRSSSPSVIVAVIDSGANLTHEDLAPNLWRNPGETPGNGLDDDGNGYIDDVFGISALGAGPPSDDAGHGTHVAGIIAAAGNNGKGVVGVSWGAKLMILKFLDSEGGGFTSDAVECIDYATENGASIINASWGDGPYSDALRDAIERAGQMEIAFVAAAGNARRNLDLAPSFPASFDVDSIIVVAAIARGGYLARFSNFGPNSIDLAAPGTDILSTSNEDSSAYVSRSGTSMAAPFVSGALALLAEEYPDDSKRVQRDRLLLTAKTIFFNHQAVGNQKLINLAAALALDHVPYPPVLQTDFNRELYRFEGERLELETRDEGANDAAYQWYFEDAPIPEANSLVLTFPKLSNAHSGHYRLVATNEDGMDELEFDLHVDPAGYSLRQVLDYPEGDFTTTPNSTWQATLDPIAVGGSKAVVTLDSTGESQELRITLSGPGQVRFNHRHNLDSESPTFSAIVDGVERRFSVWRTWQQFYTNIESAGEHELIIKLDQREAERYGDMVVSFDEFAFYPLDALPPLVEPILVNTHYPIGDTVVLILEGRYNPTSYTWFKDGVQIPQTSAMSYQPDRQRFGLNLGYATESIVGDYRLVLKNEFGTDISLPIPVSIRPGAPRFLDDQGSPNNTIIANEGESVELKRTFVGPADLEYQWYYKDEPIEGANSAILEIDPVTLFDTGGYYLVARYAPTGESSKSRNISLSVESINVRPWVEKAPVTQWYWEGDSIELLFGASGTKPLSYQWYKDGEVIPEETGDQLIFTAASVEDSGIYTLRVSNRLGSDTSGQYSVTVQPITDRTKALDSDHAWELFQRVNAFDDTEDSRIGGSSLKIAPIGESSLRVSARSEIIGPAILEFSIFVAAPNSGNPIDWKDATISPMVGGVRAYTKTLELGWNDLFVVIPEGLVEVILEVEADYSPFIRLDRFVINSGPHISKEPLSTTHVLGTPAFFEVEAYGRDLAYQWFKNDIPMPGKIDPQLNFPNLNESDAANYFVRVANAFGAQNSRVVTLAPIESYSEILGLTNAIVTFYEGDDWRVFEDDQTGDVYLESGELAAQESARINIQVTGPKRLEFDYKSNDAIKVTINGSEETYLDSSVEWDHFELLIGSGISVIEIEYLVTESTTGPALLRNLAVEDRPIFLTQPTDRIVSDGPLEDALSAEVMGMPAVSMSWYRNDILVSSEHVSRSGNVSILSLEAFGDEAVGEYYCVASFPGGFELRSDTANVTEMSILEAVDLSSDLQFEIEYLENALVDPDSNAVGGAALKVINGPYGQAFKIVAPQGGFVSFRMKTNALAGAKYVAVSASGTNWRIVTDETRDWTEYQLPVALEPNGYVRFHFFSDGDGFDDAAVWVDSIHLLGMPIFESQPPSIQSPLGADLELTADVFSETPPTYQWEKSGEPIAGANENILRIDNLDVSKLGEYALVATNSAGSARSQIAQVEIDNGLGAAIEAPWLPIQTIGAMPWSLDAETTANTASSLFTGNLKQGDRSTLSFSITGPVEIGFQALRRNLNAYVLIDGKWEVGISYERWGFNRFKIEEAKTVKISIIAELGIGQVQLEPEDAGLWIDRLQFRTTRQNSFSEWYKIYFPNFDHGVVRSAQDQQFLDGDFDGISNVLEFLLGMDPRTRSHMPYPKMQTGPAGSQWVLEASIRESTDYSLIVEYSTDLRAWSRLELTEEPSRSEFATLALRKHVIAIPIDSEDRSVFIRWTADVPDGRVSVLEAISHERISP